VLKGHKGRVGALGWAGKDVGKVVYSGGWDGSLRGWDVETGANVVVRVSFPLLSITSVNSTYILIFHGFHAMSDSS
jgi:WD40 repeat protein